jgi:hypothetical protein
MNLTIEQLDGGFGRGTQVMARVGDDVAIIDRYVIEGIVRVTVQGRDVEDGLAPLDIIAAIIEAKLGIESTAWPKVDWPDWLGGEDARTDMIREFGITPMVLALASLEMFGGETKIVQFP